MALRKLLAPLLPKPGTPAELPLDEAKHALQVLRLESGDPVEVIDGHGNAVHARLERSGKRVFVEYIGPVIVVNPSAQVLPITLEQAILKGDAMSWVIEKAVELGVQNFVPVVTARTVVQIDKKGPEALVARWEKIANQSLKQCGRLRKMKICAPKLLQDLESGVDRFWCDESTQNESACFLWNEIDKIPLSLSQEIHLLIGPEGGWEPTERQILMSYPDFGNRRLRQISLGPLVLRAETATLFSISLLTGFLRKLA